MLFSLALVLVGVLFLLRNTGLLPSPAWDVAWPIILIVLGVALFLESKHGVGTGLCWPGCPCANGTPKRNGRRAGA